VRKIPRKILYFVIQAVISVAEPVILNPDPDPAFQKNPDPAPGFDDQNLKKIEG
jgi:hypothetical protein